MFFCSRSASWHAVTCPGRERQIPDSLPARARPAYRSWPFRTGFRTAAHVDGDFRHESRSSTIRSLIACACRQGQFRSVTRPLSAFAPRIRGVAVMTRTCAKMEPWMASRQSARRRSGSALLALGLPRPSRPPSSAITTAVERSREWRRKPARRFRSSGRSAHRDFDHPARDVVGAADGFPPLAALERFSGDRLGASRVFRYNRRPIVRPHRW